jgi:catechol 2,3-dioxygenase-like lactoylglutathione lyase family enzyme
MPLGTCVVLVCSVVSTALVPGVVLRTASPATPAPARIEPVVAAPVLPSRGGPQSTGGQPAPLRQTAVPFEPSNRPVINRARQRETAMNTWEPRARVVVGSVSLEVPAGLVPRGKPIDSAAGMFEGHGLVVTVDQGPFTSRLDSHAGRPDYRESSREIGGVEGREVFFRDPDSATYTIALHLPAPRYVTVVVRADSSVPEAVSRRILDSVRLVN